MAEKIKVLKGISKGGETYDIDAKYWNGKTDIDHIYVWDVSFICDSNGAELNPSIANSYSSSFKLKYIAPVIENYLEGKPIYIYKVISRDPYDDDVITDAILLPTYVVQNGYEFHIHVYTTSIDTNPNLDMVYGNYIINYNDLYDDANATLGMYGYINEFADVDNLKTINGQSLLGNEDIRTNIYCTCDSASNLITKTINISNVSLMDGMHIWINFKNGHDEFVESGDIAIKSNITHAGGTLENVPILFKGISGGSTNLANIYNGYYYQPIFGSGIYEFILCAPNTEITTWTLNFTGSHTSIKEPFIYMKTSRITLSNITNIYSVLREGIHVKFDDTILYQLSVVSDTGLYKSDCSFEFTTGTTAPTLICPSAWKWANGIVPHITANKRYHVSVKNNCAVIAEFDV